MELLIGPLRAVLLAWFEVPERYFARRRMRFAPILDAVVTVAEKHGRYAAIAEYRRQTGYPLDRCRIGTYRVLRGEGLWGVDEPSVKFPHSVDWERLCCHVWMWTTWMLIGLVSLPVGFYCAMAIDHWLNPDSLHDGGP